MPNQITGQHDAIVLYKNSAQRPVYQAFCFDGAAQASAQTILATLGISQPKIVTVHDAEPSLLTVQRDYRTMMACDAVIRALPGSRPSLTNVTMRLSEHHFTEHASKALATVSAETTRTTWFADNAFTKTISDARNVIACSAAQIPGHRH